MTMNALQNDVGHRQRGSVSNMDVKVGDVLEMKKPHPCSGKSFVVLRVGMDFKIKCQSCGREVMVPRSKIEKNIKKIVRGE